MSAICQRIVTLQYCVSPDSRQPHRVSIKADKALKRRFNWSHAATPFKKLESQIPSRIKLTDNELSLATQRSRTARFDWSLSSRIVASCQVMDNLTIAAGRAGLNGRTRHMQAHASLDVESDLESLFSTGSQGRIRVLACIYSTGLRRSPHIAGCIGIGGGNHGHRARSFGSKEGRKLRRIRKRY